MTYWSKVPGVSKTAHDTVVSLGYPPHLSGEITLLKTPHILATRCRKISIKPIWKHPPCWIASLYLKVLAVEIVRRGNDIKGTT